MWQTGSKQQDAALWKDKQRMEQQTSHPSKKQTNPYAGFLHPPPQKKNCLKIRISRHISGCTVCILCCEHQHPFLRPQFLNYGGNTKEVISAYTK